MSGWHTSRLVRGSVPNVKTFDSGVIDKRLVHDIPAFIIDGKTLKKQTLDAKVFRKSPK